MTDLASLRAGQLIAESEEWLQTYSQHVYYVFLKQTRPVSHRFQQTDCRRVDEQRQNKSNQDTVEVKTHERSPTSRQAIDSLHTGMRSYNASWDRGVDFLHDCSIYMYIDLRILSVHVHVRDLRSASLAS